MEVVRQDPTLKVRVANAPHDNTRLVEVMHEPEANYSIPVG